MRDFEMNLDILKARDDLRLQREYQPKDDEGIERKPIPPWGKFVLCILLVAFLLSIVYSFIHPLDKLKIKLWLTDNCTIKMVYYESPSYSKEEYILIDGNFIQIGSEYYELDNGSLYIYEKDYFGRWNKKLVEDIDAFSEDYELGAKLLEKSNYHRAKGKMFVWYLNKNVKKEFNFNVDISVRRKFGRISIVINSGYLEPYICIYRFGRTKIDLPWEEEK